MRGTYVILPKLRVHAKPGGRIETGHREGAIRPTDESWWTDVLNDPRTRIPKATNFDEDSPYAAYRLDRQDQYFIARCPCGREEWLDRDKLIKEVGASMNVIHLAREWMPCRERNKLANFCQAYVILSRSRD